MVLPLAVMAMAAVGLAFLAAGCHLALVVSGRFRRLRDWGRIRARVLSERLAAMPGATLAQLLLLGNIAVLGVILWRFAGVLAGLDSLLLQVSPENLAAFAPKNAQEARLFRQVLSLELFVFGIAWYRLLKRRYTARDRKCSISGA